MAGVLHLTTVHSVGDVRIFMKEVRSLRKNSFDVTIAGIRSEPHPDDLEPAIVFEPIASRSRRFYASVSRAIEVSRKLRPDILHFHDPEILLALPFMRRYCGAIVYDSHEFLSETVHDKDYIPKFLRSFIGNAIGSIERMLLRFVDAVVVTTPHMEKYFSGFHEQVIRVANYPVRASMPELSSFEGREQAAIYTGTLGKKRGLAQMIEAAETSDIGLYLAGSVDSGVTAYLAGQLPHQIHLEGYVSHGASLAMQTRVMLGMSVLQPFKQYFNAIPTKILEFLAAGLIVISSDFPFLRQMFAGFSTIKFVNPEDVPLIATAMREAIGQYGTSAAALRESRARVLRDFTWEAEVEKLLLLYRQLLDGLPRKRSHSAERKV